MAHLKAFATLQRTKAVTEWLMRAKIDSKLMRCQERTLKCGTKSTLANVKRFVDGENNNDGASSDLCQRARNVCYLSIFVMVIIIIIVHVTKFLDLYIIFAVQ
jgi:hypothetical protein